MRKEQYSTEELYNHLNVGIENAKKQSQIKNELGYSARATRLAVNDLRREGYPICSGNEGYWIAKNADEIDRTISRLYSEMDNIRETIYCLNFAKERL